MFLALFGSLYSLFGPFVILFNTKTPFLALLGIVFLDFPLRGGGTPLSAKIFLAK